MGGGLWVSQDYLFAFAKGAIAGIILKAANDTFSISVLNSAIAMFEGVAIPATILFAALPVFMHLKGCNGI